MRTAVAKVPVGAGQGAETSFAYEAYRKTTTEQKGRRNAVQSHKISFIKLTQAALCARMQFD